jgi:hemolysin type calcium-binding protein/WD40 repeat protein
MGRKIFALVGASVLGLVPLGAASASVSTAKNVAYVSGGDLYTINASGIGTTNLGESPNNPSFSSDGQKIYFDDGASVRWISAGGPADSSTSLCAGTNPAISPDGTKLAFESGGSIVVRLLDCSGGSSFGAGSAPAWSPDGTQIVFVDSASDLAVAPSGGGAPEKLGTTSAVESAPAWSPDGEKIAYTANSELYVINLAVNPPSTQPLTNNAVVEENPSWAPGGDEIVYTAGGALQAVPSAGGSARVFQDASGASQPSWELAVASTSPPTITRQDGATAWAEGVQLSADIGTWISISGITSHSYQWKRCGTAGTGCTSIAGASEGTYTLATGDIGSTIRVVVTATTPDGSAPGTSAATPVIVAAPPANITPPTITGTPTIGLTLTASTGSWSGSNPVFTYQWHKCDVNGDSCSNISGATANEFVPGTDELGSTLRVTVTATNGLGSASKISNPTPVVASNKPVNTALPSISTLPPIGTETTTTFTATAGIWSGTPTITFRYQWRRCDSSGGSCSDISGATLTTYVASAADVGRRLRVVVTATNSFGTGTATSEPSDMVAGTAPTNTFRPSISGAEEVGELLFASPGTWTGSAPITYTYQWRRCNAAGAGCVAIPSSTSSSYVLQVGDVGSTILVAVTATNAVGSATSLSSPTEVVQPASGGGNAVRPTSTTAPSIKGVLARGKTLTAVNGTWTGTTPMTFSYQWSRCPLTGTTCTAIALATRGTYVLTAADVNRRIRLQISAANAAGTTPALSAITGKVGAAKPPAGPKTIKGTARADRLKGTAAAEIMRGGGGNDTISAGGGADSVYGDAGNDRLDGGSGRDKVFGGSGNDAIVAADGAVDRIDCGAGKDTIRADRKDVVRNCEKVTRK